ADLGRKVSHGVERGQIGDIAPRTGELRRKLRHAHWIASVGKYLPAGSRKFPGQVPSEPRGSTSDKHSRRSVSHLSSSGQILISRPCWPPGQAQGRASHLLILPPGPSPRALLAGRRPSPGGNAVKPRGQRAQNGEYAPGTGKSSITECDGTK